jgi:hypothetical protein
VLVLKDALGWCHRFFILFLSVNDTGAFLSLCDSCRIYETAVLSLLGQVFILRITFVFVSEFGMHYINSVPR